MPALIDDMGFHVLLILMVLASIAGLAAGVVLIVHPGWLGKAGRYSNRWVSTRKLDRSLEKWISLDKWFYQYHRVSGSLMLAGAAWILVFFVTSFDKQRLLAELSRDIHAPLQFMAGLVDAFVLMSIAGAVFAVLVSMFLLFRPSLLRDFEEGANKWLSLRKSLKPVEIPRPSVDEYVFRNFRLVGVMLLLGSLYILSCLVFWLR